MSHWDKIFNIIEEKKLSLENQTQIMISFLNSILTANVEILNNDELNKTLKDFPNEIMKNFVKIDLVLPKDDNLILKFYDNYVK